MTDWTVSTNFISWPLAMRDEFGWPADGLEVDAILRMAPGDLIVPKFAQAPGYPGQDGYQRAIVEKLPRGDFDKEREQYANRIMDGAGAVPFVLRVREHLEDRKEFPYKSSPAWVRVSVDRLDLEHPISTSEYLRLRVVPVELAGQFKAMAAPNRHIQALPDGAGEAVLRLGNTSRRGPEDLRQHVLVRAADADEALRCLAAEGTELREDDRAFLAVPERIAGLHVVDASGQLRPQGEPIEIRPEGLRALFERAQANATTSDRFRPARAFKAADELSAFVADGDAVKEIVEFGRFHDRYVLLPRKVTEALDLAERTSGVSGLSLAMPIPTGAELRDPEESEAEDPQLGDLDRLHGITVGAVRAALPADIAMPDAVLAEAVTALRSNKHLLLSGPPGTGKSTLAGALCRAVVESRFRLTTATAGWTAFDTVGGYMPQEGGLLKFEPGIVLRCLKEGAWLVIDELNRADIDKAFGPLFSLLAGGSAAEQHPVVLPFREGPRPIEVVWRDRVSTEPQQYAITPSWRLIGTMNVADKASLFQLSFAFLRRFAVIDVPLPDRTDYEGALLSSMSTVDSAVRQRIGAAALDIAFSTEVPIGPAILLDVGSFIERGLTRTSGGKPAYDDPVQAFLTATRLFVIPQYEGASQEAVDYLFGVIDSAFPERTEGGMSQLRAAVDAVTSI